jgi:hypothetical protein
VSINCYSIGAENFLGNIFVLLSVIDKL